jgi:Protein of unknown function (DUF1585)
MPEVARCLTEKLMTYALGRGIEPYDKRALEQIEKNLAADGYRFQTLIHEIVTSLPFQSRRGESAAQPKQVLTGKNKEVAPK